MHRPRFTLAVAIATVDRMRIVKEAPRTISRRLLAAIPVLVALLLACACQAGADAGPDSAAGADDLGSSSEVAGPKEAATLPQQAPGPTLELDPLYQPWGRILAAYVDDEGLVDYAGLSTRGRADLEEFMQGLAAVDPGGMPNEAAQIAFWINAYNATVLWQVVEAYPLESVRDVGALWGLVGGFFKQENVIAGEARSLDDIEHGILRSNYADARIHWALVCGAFGCPRLLRRPYLAADLDSVLTAQAFEFVAQDRGLRLDRNGNTLHLSRYFDWYAEDFEAESDSVTDYLLRYVEDDVADYLRRNRDAITIQFMDYDWTLNDQARGPR
jgi:hypothetical protein